MEQAEIAQIIDQAIAHFYMRDRRWIIRNASEQTMTARLARDIEDQVHGYDVSVECNRHGVLPKEVDLPDGDGVLTRARVKPDIIIHQTGHDHDNLLVIEAKTSANPKADEHDLAKLRAIKD